MNNCWFWLENVCFALPNSQCSLSDMPRLHVADESNMAPKMDELEIFRYPGNARSKGVGIFWFSSSEGRAHFDFCLDEKYVECLLVDFSDYNR